MADPLPLVAIVAALVLFGAGALAAAIGRRAGPILLLVAVGCEVVQLVLVATLAVLLARGAVVHGLAIFLAYLAVAVVAIPVAALWAIGDETRWGGLVYGIAGLTDAIVVVRLQDLWISSHG